ncbi:MAG: nucleotidyltransferase, partial [Acidimicrobiales bacterium]
WGIDTVLIGSYARRTGIHPGKDVDVFSKMTSLDTSVSPAGVYEGVSRVLTAHYGNRVTPRSRSLKIDFSADGFSVDAVPAVRVDEKWAIPAKDATSWSKSTEEAWVLTDPERLTDLTQARNQAPTVNGQGAYVPTVKLARQVRSHHLRDHRPGGLYIEFACYWAFEQGAGAETFAACLHGVLQHAAGHLRDGEALIDPALGTPYSPSLTSTEREAAASLFGSLASSASEALNADRCKAAALWRAILGRNDRGAVFPLPEGCDETGRELTGITAVSSRGTDEARGFG